MTVTLTHVYDGESRAGGAVQDLQRAGFTEGEISVARRRPETSRPGDEGDGDAILVSVHTGESKADEAEAIMQRHGPVEMLERATACGAADSTGGDHRE